MTERRVGMCIICHEHRAEQGEFCARCWAEFADDIQRDAPWIKELRQPPPAKPRKPSKPGKRSNPHEEEKK